MINNDEEYNYAKTVVEPLFLKILTENYPDYSVIKADELFDKYGYDILMSNKNNDEEDVFGFDVKMIPVKHRKAITDKNCYSISEHSKENSNLRRMYAFQEYDSTGKETGRFIVAGAKYVNENLAVSKSSTPEKKSYYISIKMIMKCKDKLILF